MLIYLYNVALQIQYFGDLIKNNFSHNFKVFFAIYKNWDLLVQGLSTIIGIFLLIEMMPFGLLQRNEGAVLGHFPIS